MNNKPEVSIIGDGAKSGMGIEVEWLTRERRERLISEKRGKSKSGKGEKRRVGCADKALCRSYLHQLHNAKQIDFSPMRLTVYLSRFSRASRECIFHVSLATGKKLPN